MSDRSVVVVGCSWGGFHALRQILAAVPGGFTTPIVIAQHRLPGGDGLAQTLQSASHIPIADVTDKEPLQPGAAYLAPADYHLFVERGSLALSIDDLVQFARPSVDVLFESAADAYGEGVVAVLLTGANEDGAEGLRRVKDKGGFTIVQDPATAVRKEMPLAALAAVEPDAVLPLDQIGPFLVDLCTPSVMGPTGA